MAKQKYRKTKLIDALNRIDELASAYANNENQVEVDGEDIGEASQLEKDYNLVFDFISDMFKPMSEYMKGGKKK